MARVVRTTFAVTLVVRKANALAISVWCTYAQAFLVRSGMCADMRRPGGEYLASLRSERLDVSVAYLVSGRSPCIRTQNFFPDVDNQGTIQLVKNLKFHEHTKHISVRFHFIRDACEQNAIKTTYLPTSNMLADIMTKNLTQELTESTFTGLGS